MTSPNKSKDPWDNPTDNEEYEKKELGHNARGNIITVLLTAVIITGGFILPTLIYPYFDSYSNSLVQLASSEDDMVSGHVFEEPVTLYPWDIYDEAQLRGLTSYEMNTLEQSGVADLLVSNMQLRGMQLESEYYVYTQRILNSFRFLDAADSSQLSCLVLVDADINMDGLPDLRCAVDMSGKLVSLLFVSEEWTTLQLTAPLIERTVPTDESTGSAGEISNEPVADGSNAAANETGEPPATPTDSSTPYEPQVDFRPLQEEENIWLFSYVISREALLAGQNEVYSAFRLLDLNYEERFKYPFLNLIVAPSGYVEALPEVELMTMTTHQLATGAHLLRIYDFSNGVRLILYINTNTQYCDGFNLSTVPL